MTRTIINSHFQVKISAIILAKKYS